MPSLPSSYNWLMTNRPTTLAHVDFRLDNFFFDRPAAPVTIIDWQLSVRSLGAFDIGYFIVQSLTTEMRREHGEALLRRWYDRLVELGVTGYTWDDALADFHDSVMLQMTIPVIAAANLDPANERGRAVARVSRPAQLPGIGRLRVLGVAHRLIDGVRCGSRASSLQCRRSGSRTSRCNRSGRNDRAGVRKGESSRWCGRRSCCIPTRRAHCRSSESRWPVAAEALEQSMLESKDKEQLLAIAQALGIKTTARAAKATLIDKILETTGGSGPAAEAPASSNGRASKSCQARAGRRVGRGRCRVQRQRRVIGHHRTAEHRSTPARRRRRGRGRSRPRRRATGRLGDRIDPLRRGAGHRAPAHAGRVEARRRTGLAQAVPMATTARAMATARAATAAAGGVGATRVVATGRKAPIKSGSSGRMRIADDTAAGPPINMEPVKVSGYLDLRDEGYGFLRVNGYLASRDDAYIPVKLTRQYGLAQGRLRHRSQPSRRSQREEPGDARDPLGQRR